MIKFSLVINVKLHQENNEIRILWFCLKWNYQ